MAQHDGNTPEQRHRPRRGRSGEAPPLSFVHFAGGRRYDPPDEPLAPCGRGLVKRLRMRQVNATMPPIAIQRSAHGTTLNGGAGAAAMLREAGPHGYLLRSQIETFVSASLCPYQRLPRLQHPEMIF
jgi:hypothetical protein